ncbi:hypothetical protein DUNSADRAFT_10977 [Dunaliella salina]|uniref:Uncharacterized protein n=1 Tax=Dunaliella salina TaxID=3046 RepID=A0ABQ7GEC5_DUNSA|nr:hypothetical protein DUNSADRAFT_10977 [Dunaliella salina]|eukprot:KAF5832960.1 hypothetical protein DUNSADRAFT_10977 [Dunaliella salina]
MRFFNGLFSSKKKQAGDNPNLQNWGSAATSSNNGTPVLLEYSDDDSSVELSSSSTEDESHQLPYLPSKHGSHRRARCPPFGAKSLMGFVSGMWQNHIDASTHPVLNFVALDYCKHFAHAMHVLTMLRSHDAPLR